MFGLLRNAAVSVVLLASSSIAGAQGDTTKVDISGNWTFTVVYEGGQGTPTVRFVQRGDTLTGKYISNSFGELDLRGSIKGREFDFQVTTSAGGDPFTMTFNGTVERADLLKGSVDLGGNGSATFQATKAKENDRGGYGRNTEHAGRTRNPRDPR
jgi:hypothetical protein